MKTTQAEETLRILLRQIDPSFADLSAEQILTLLTGAAGLGESDGQAGPAQRWQDQLIEKEIPQGSTVLDLGCGEGQLLAKLMRDRQARVQGIELDSEAVFACVERGVPVLQSNLDAGLKGLADQSFDYVVLEETLQTLHRPTRLLEEMLRVGRTGIVSFPNFGHWRVRLDLALGGRMPVTGVLPYQWHDTPNIRLLTLRDFLDWAQHHGVRVVRGYALRGGQVRPLEESDNLHAEEVLLVIERQLPPESGNSAVHRLLFCAEARPRLRAQLAGRAAG
jgi:methionine biosynthesis protein MetW